MRPAVLLLTIAALAGATHADDSRTELTPDQVRTAIQRGLEFLLKDQNPDGSWGGCRNAVYTFTGAVWSNPETHRSWKVATTGLGYLAVLEVGDSQAAEAAADRAIDYLLKTPPSNAPTNGTP